MRAVRQSSSTPVLRAPGASASGMSPKKCPTPIDGSRTCAPASTPRRSRASHTPYAHRGVLRAGAAMLFGMNGESLAKLADANHAEIKQVVVSGLQPPRHAWIGLNAGQLGRDVGIEQETPGYERSTGRAPDLLRLKSRSSPFRGDSANSSTRLFLPAGPSRWDDGAAAVSFSSRASRAFSRRSSTSWNWPR